MRLRVKSVAGDNTGSILTKLMTRLGGGGTALDIEAGSLRPEAVVQVATNDFRVVYRGRALRFWTVSTSIFITEEIAGAAINTPAGMGLTASPDTTGLEFFFTEDAIGFVASSNLGQLGNLFAYIDLPDIAQYSGQCSRIAAFNGQTELATRQYPANGGTSLVVGTGYNTLATLAPSNSTFYAPDLAGMSICTQIPTLQTVHGASRLVESLRKSGASLAYGDRVMVGAETFVCVSNQFLMKEQ